jgi:hypothetical protein
LKRPILSAVSSSQAHFNHFPATVISTPTTLMSIDVAIYTSHENIPPGLLTFVANRATCGACGVSSPRQRCSACKAVWYCNRHCQRGAWRLHKLSCQLSKDAGNQSARVQQITEFMRQRNLQHGIYATIFSRDGSEFVLFQPACPDSIRDTIKQHLTSSSPEAFSKSYRGHLLTDS